MRWMHGIRARLRLLRGRSSDERMLEEIHFHLEMEAQKYVREGMSPEEARRRAVLAFGGVEGHKEEMREGRTLAWLGGFSLDLKLGLRMMLKHPGLTLVGGMGMAVAVAVGAGGFGFVSALIDPSPPLPEGERLVSIQHATESPGIPNHRLLHDFIDWRGELRSVDDLAAFRDVGHNLITGEGPPQRIEVAEITASGFRAARVPPLLGRYLLPEDEMEGALPVVVVGYDLWQRRFGGDPGLVGQVIQLGDTRHTVVGVMPEGFAFPVNHGIWTPLRLDPSRYERGQGPELFVFGRLAPGVSMEEARAELQAIGQRTAAAFPESHERLRPQVMPYTYPFAGAESPLVAWAFHLMRLVASLLLVVVAVNVAVLVYARTAMRLDEIAVRTALGASRRRVITQLFLEALVLSLTAAAAGLAMAGIAMKRFGANEEQLGGDLPFWVELGVSRGMVAYAVGLAVFAALIVGAVPGLQATGRRVQPRLQRLSSGGSAMRLGRTWMALIVVQVALAVAVLPPALFFGARWVRPGLTDPGFRAEPFLTATLLHEREAPLPGADDEAEARAFAARYAARVTELVRRLDAEPGISDVIVTASTPGQEWQTQIEVEDASGPGGRGPAQPGPAVHSVGRGHVDAAFFDAFDIRLLTGRLFDAADADSTATAVIVNQSFVREVLGGGNALGRRVRSFVPPGPAGGANPEPEPWLEIVGVVSDFPPNPVDPSVSLARMYDPLRLGTFHPARITMRVTGQPPAAFAGRLREVTAAVDPTLTLGGLRPLEEYLLAEQVRKRFTATLVGTVTLSVLLLSAAGIYALMSFTVTRRRREIGIRSALGAHPGRILRSVFARAAGQLALGASIGLGLSLVLDRVTGGELLGGAGSLLLPAVVLVMTVVGLLAALGPARRALRIEPMEALRGE